jgi:hypothetical protein
MEGGVLTPYPVFVQLGEVFLAGVKGCVFGYYLAVFRDYCRVVSAITKYVLSEFADVVIVNPVFPGAAWHEVFIVADVSSDGLRNGTAVKIHSHVIFSFRFSNFLCSSSFFPVQTVFTGIFTSYLPGHAPDLL